jgi:hypothetical protein
MSGATPCSTSSPAGAAARGSAAPPPRAQRPPPPLAAAPPSRRGALAGAAAAAAAGLAARPAAASKLPEAADRAWSALGGGPADLVFDESFLGEWEVTSLLASVERPLGAVAGPNGAAAARAEAEDLNRALKYKAAWMRNARGEVVPDRRYNTASLLAAYMPGTSAAELAAGVDWDVDDPNRLELRVPGGARASTRVTRRGAESPAAATLWTSEFFQQTFDAPGRPGTRVKASQCFTKYRWRPAAAAAGGPEVVATQVVSDYAAPADVGAVVQARGQPVVVMTYWMAFTRVAPPAAPPGGA